MKVLKFACWKGNNVKSKIKDLQRKSGDSDIPFWECDETNAINIAEIEGVGNPDPTLSKQLEEDERAPQGTKDIPHGREH